jgi:hypothetical protein
LAHVVRHVQVGVPLVLIWASWLLSCDSKLQTSYFGGKLLWYFSSILNRQKKRLLLKLPSASAILSKYGEIPKQILEQSLGKVDKFEMYQLLIYCTYISYRGWYGSPPVACLP